MYVSCPNIAFQHLCEALDFTDIPNQWSVHYPSAHFAPEETPEEALIRQEMEDEDGCQEWRNGFCSCDDCSEPYDVEDDDRFDTLAEAEDYYA